LEKIKQKLSTYNFADEKILKNISINHQEDEVFHIKTPNIYIAKYVKRYFLETISSIIKEEFSINPKIEIITNENSIVEYKEKETTPSILNPNFVFETFVVGKSNQFAYTAAKQAAQKPGKLYNPLFIYGGVGLGKTHLMQAIGNYVQKHFNLKVIYVTGEQFLNDFSAHLKRKTMNQFQEKYRNCDCLLIDDIQFLTGKDKIQEEFFHTFNELYNNKKMICLTSDRPPQQLKDIVDRLRNRFEAGLVADIQPPELPTKIAIIKKKCEINNINLSDEVIEFIATRINDSIREIEGIIVKLEAMSKLLGVSEIDIAFAEKVLKEYHSDKASDISLENIIKLIAKEFNIKPSEITSKSRSRNIVLARRTAIFLAREFTNESTAIIAQYFGLKDHSAVSHSIKQFKKKISQDNELKIKIEALKSKIHKKNVN